MAELVDGEGWISDESSFYGDNDQKSEWEKRVDAFDPVEYLAKDRFDLNIIAVEAAARADKESVKNTNAVDLYNPFEGKPSGRQLSETVAEFLARLPPCKTKLADINDWIWIANPYASGRVTDADYAGFKDEADHIIEDFEANRRATTESLKKATKAAIDKAVDGDRKEAVNSLLDSAKTHGVTSGKWMLFPLPEKVDLYWQVIAEGTAKGRLGTGAKVAPDEGKGDRIARLICVYTRDFSDKADVKRVLLGLVEEGLVQRRGSSPIYYKCDAWTHMGIDRNNGWGFKATMYASNELLTEKL